MRIFILCAVLSVLLANSLASPVKTQIFDDNDTDNFDNNSSSSEEEKVQVKVQKFKVKDNNDEEDIAESSEEDPHKNTIVKDEVIGSNSVEEEVLDENNISKRAVDSTPHTNNKILVSDIKDKNNLAFKHLKRALQNDLYVRKERSADSSEENSSEEDKKGNSHATDKHSGTSDAAAAAVVKISETTHVETLEVASTPVPAESEPKPEGSRRKRNTSNDKTSEENSSEEEHVNAAVASKSKTNTADNVPIPRRKRNLQYSSDDDQSIGEQEVNEVFIFSNEQQQDSEESLKSDHLKNNEYTVINDISLELSRKTVEKKISEEDYAQGCGNNASNSNENFNENN